MLSLRYALRPKPMNCFGLDVRGPPGDQNPTAAWRWLRARREPVHNLGPAVRPSPPLRFWIARVRSGEVARAPNRRYRSYWRSFSLTHVDEAIRGATAVDSITLVGDHLIYLPNMSFEGL